MNGIVKYGAISSKKNIFWEIQLFAFIRHFKDGITPIKFNINYDNYESEHSPAFQIELTVFNIYNHIWVYKNQNEKT